MTQAADLAFWGAFQVYDAVASYVNWCSVMRHVQSTLKFLRLIDSMDKETECGLYFSNPPESTSFIKQLYVM